MSAYCRTILVFTCLAHTLTHVLIDLYTPLYRHAMAPDLRMSESNVAGCFSVLSLCFGLGALPAGWLSDRIGERALLLAFYFVSALGSVLIAVATGPASLLFGAVVLGAATSIYHPVGNALISKGVERRGWAMGVNGIFGSLGTALSPVLASLIAYVLNWRAAFFAMALPCLGLGLWMWTSDLGPAAEPLPRGHADPAATAAPTARRGSLRGLFLVVAVLALAMTIGGLNYKLLVTAYPTYLGDAFAKGFGGKLPSEALEGGLKAGLALLFGGVGQYVAGRLSDRHELRWLYVLNYGLIVPLFLLQGFASGFLALPAACAASAVLFAAQPIENTLIAKYSPAAWRGLFYSVKFVLVFAVGGAGTWIAGGLIAKGHLSWVFHLATIGAALALAGALFAARRSLSPATSAQPSTQRTPK